MIEKHTVLVLGAGASAPYDFPTAGELRDRIILELPDEHTFEEAKPGDSSEALVTCGHPKKHLAHFREELLLSMQPSVDMFLEGRPDFIELGKDVIAAFLIPREDTRNLGRPFGMHWYKYLFQRMGSRIGDVTDSLLSVITFNYDRSLEYFLFNTYQRAFGLSEKEAAQLLGSMPLVHVYGDLGKPAFWNARDGRPYVPERTPESIRRAASSIKIMDERTEESEEFQRAHEMIRNAEVLCFLGFGYHETNLARLRAGELFEGEQLLGCGYRLRVDERRRTEAAFYPSKVINLGPASIDALDFLIEYSVLG
jgi:hypothetical protein